MSQSTFQQSITTITNASDIFFQQARATGLRKRNSLFNRAEPRNDGPGDREVPAETTSRAISAPQDLPHLAKRPEKAERRSTEPDGKRHSLFSRRKSAKKGKTVLSSPDASFDESEEDQLTSLEVLYPRECFQDEEDYYRYLRKQSISPPFNFQHNIHTRHKHIPDLATVDEKDLSREFWAVHAYQTPRKQLNGIAADELTEKLASMGVSRGAASSRPTSPVPVSPALSGKFSFSDSETRSNYSRRRKNWEGKRSVNTPPRTPDLACHPAYRQSLPQRRSSLGSPKSSATKRDSFSTRTSQDSYCSLPIANQFLSQATEFPSISSALAAVPETMEQATQAHRTKDQMDQLKYRSQQPLPALPSQTRDRRSRATTESHNAAHDTLTSLQHSSGAATAPQSRRSSNHIRLAPAATISSPDLRRPKMSSGSSWEDDVDFCYEQEAEATCDFDWEASEIEQKEQHDTAASHAISLRPGSTTLPRTPENRDSLCAQKRSPNIGHQGFKQARHDSKLYLPASTPEDRPITSADLPPLEAIGGDYFTEPESNRSAKYAHRESSSYGSRESIIRSTAALEEVRHASLVSMASVPDLYSSRSSSSANTIPRSEQQRPLTAAGCEKLMNDGTPSLTGGELMRKPSTHSGRAILQAGRASQRVRPLATSRFSKIGKPEQAKAGDGEAPWI